LHCQVAADQDAEQTVDLVQRLHRCGGIVHCRGQRSERDVGEYPQRESRILLEGALNSGVERSEDVAVGRAVTTVDHSDSALLGDHLAWHHAHFDQHIVSVGDAHKARYFERLKDRRPTGPRHLRSVAR
jgi:hypothetical protein